MNKQPVLYLQTDARWKNKLYRTVGENSTIGSAGCGPTCAAMLIETLTGKTFTPEDACNWSMERGYKALNQGTYYSYFKPQFAAFGIECDMLNWTSTYGKPNHTNHDRALELLKQGYYLIALMNRGNWTSSGHFIVVWWADGKIRINDPASTKDSRVNGDSYTFRSEVKYYWWVDARKYNHPEEEINMNKQELKELISETVKEVIDDENPIYKDLADVPDYWKHQAAALLNAGAVNGGTPAEVCDTDLNIRRETLKAAIMAVMYQKAGDKPQGRREYPLRAIFIWCSTLKLNKIYDIRIDTGAAT